MPGDGKPTPIVKRPRLVRHGPTDPGTRRGRGFSVGELREAGLTVKKALKMGIPVDLRRRSVHKWNVDALKRFLQGGGGEAASHTS